MRVKIKAYPKYYGPYQTLEWIYYLFKKKDSEGLFKETPEWLDKLGERYSKTWLGQKHIDLANWYINYKEQKRVSVKIDSYDTWSMDSTLSYIIIPMLKQLKETKQGAPWVDDEDVPVAIQSKSDTDYDKKKYSINGELDKFFFDRWEWVINEMIWAFEEIVKDDIHENETVRKAHNNRINNGLYLFGKYYRSLWN